MFEKSISRFGVALGLGIPGALSCSTSDKTPGSITVNTGQEVDAWTEEPAPESVVVELVGSTRSTLATVPAPLTELSLGTDGPSNTVASFEASALDADGNVVMRGVSVPFSLYTFAGADVSLFMGRTGALSRPPGELLFSHRHPRVAVVYHGYLLIADGDATDSTGTVLDLYDMVQWHAAPQQPVLPRVPKSWATAAASVLLIDDSGAVWLDLSQNQVTAATPSAEYAAVAGGETIAGPNDTQYIVGATRKTGTPTATVLQIASDATIHVTRLKQARLGAAAAIVEGQLVVVGGADAGAGAEVANADGSGFTDLPFAPDSTQGAAVAELDKNTLVLVGGVDPATNVARGFRTLDLGCSDQCVPVDIPKLEFGLDRPRLFSLNDQQLLVSGESETGDTHVYTLEKTVRYTLTQQPLRVPRTEASVVPLPNGQVGVIGGFVQGSDAPASSLEIFIPAR